MSRTKRLLALAVIGMAVAVLPAVARAADYSTEIARILTIEKTMAAARTMAELAPYVDQNIMFDDLVPGRVSGAKAYAADVAAQFASDRNLQVTILNMHVAADDQLAYAVSIQRASFTTPANQPFVATFRQIDCYHRVGGKWLLVYQTLSVPFDPKTGKVVFDETP